MIDNKIKISVIMATYNTPIEYLKQSIDSILNQTYSNVEFIIVCDGSKSDEEYIINNYKDKRIKLINHKNNMGLPKSLNEAINCSTGKYIARMDSDDICLKNRLKDQLIYMEKNKNIDICSMYAKCIGSCNLIKGSYYIKPEEIAIQLLFMNCLIHPTVMIKKSFLDRNKIRYDENFIYSQDFELWSRITNNNIGIMRKIGILYRVHEKQVSNTKSSIQKEKRLEVIINKLNKINCNEEQYINLFMVLSSLRKITNENYKEISRSIDRFINNNSIYDTKKLKKILYNRFFQIFIKMELKNKKKIFCDKEIRKKIINIENIKYIIFVFISRIKTVLLNGVER